MGDTIRGNINFPGYNKKVCLDLFKDAIEWGRSPKYTELLPYQRMLVEKNIQSGTGNWLFHTTLMIKLVCSFNSA
jgi:hypothetical protein